MKVIIRTRKMHGVTKMSNLYAQMMLANWLSHTDLMQSECLLHVNGSCFDLDSAELAELRYSHYYLSFQVV